MYRLQRLQRLVVREDSEATPAKESVEVVYGPGGRVHLRKVWCIILLVVLQRSAGVGDDVAVAVFVNLREDGAEAPGG
jgi:hypothetical protein